MRGQHSHLVTNYTRRDYNTADQHQMETRMADKSGTIHYKVDDEPETTDQTSLTAKQIMSNAGVDPETNYLEQLVPGGASISYKDDPSQSITLKNGMHF